MRFLQKRSLLLFFLLFNIHLYAVNLSQTRINLELNDVTLEQAFNKVKQLTGHGILYQAKDVKNQRKVSVKATNETLETVLASILNDTGLTYVVRDEVIVVKKAAEKAAPVQEKKTIKLQGVVIDDLNETLPGVTVTAKGTQTRVATGLDGDYEIEVEEGVKFLVFTYVGMMPQEVAVGNQRVINVKLMPEDNTIDEVVVTGYQKIDRRLFTGSASLVKAKDAKTDGVADVSKMLQGKAAGVQLTNVSGTFGASPKLRVRGASSIYGNSSPLWVVDGVILDEMVSISASDLSSGNAATLISSAVAGLNADDIESFQILKDASATALYGSKAMNGVIVITTKRGTKGTASINYTGEFTIRTKPYYGQYDIMNSQDQMSVLMEVQANGGLSPATQALVKNGGVFNKWYKMTGQTLEDTYEGVNDDPEMLLYLRAAELRNTNWFDELFRNTLQQQHSISISGGTETLSNYTSFSYLTDPGWTISDKLDRFVFNSNTIYHFTKKLSLGIQGNASIRTQRAPGTLNRQVDVVSGEYSRDFDVNPFSYALGSSRTMDANEFYQANYAPFNIKNESENNYLELDMLDTKVQIDLSYKPIDGLELQALGAVRYAKSTREHRIKEASNMAEAYRAISPDAVRSSNNFLWQNPDNPDALPLVVMDKGGFYNTQDNNLYSYYARASANYIRSFSEGVHIINALAGGEIRNTDRLARFNNGYGYLWGSEMPVTDYRILRKVLDAGSNYFGMGQTYDRQVGFFGTGTYSYMGTYTLNATLRTEGTNQMGKATTARWLPTWNISGSWNVLNEKFMESQKLFSQLTLRGTYGLTANMSPNVDALAVYSALTTYRPYQEDRETVLEIASLANSELTWEKMLETNVGFDLSILKNRFGISFDAYWRDCYDLIGIMRTTGTGGIHQKYANYADMKSSGLEFAINTTNIKEQDFAWHSSFTFSYNKNKITNLKSQPSVISMVGLTGAAKEGYSQSGLFSVPFAGLDRNGHPTFYNENGDVVSYISFQSISTDYLKYEGQLDPKYIGGLENSLVYKNWKLDVFLTYQAGNVIRLYPMFNSNYSDIDAMTKALKDRWVRPGDELYTNIPAVPSSLYLTQNTNLAAAYNAYNYSTERVAKGDFIRLKDISLTYDFDKKIAESIGLRSLQLKGVASNVCLLYSDKALNGQDPEFSRSGGVALPTPRQFTLSVRAGF